MYSSWQLMNQIEYNLIDNLQQGSRFL